MEQATGNAFLSFVPLLIIIAIQCGFAWPIIGRKGMSKGYLILCAIPWLGLLVTILIASIPDKAVLDRLAELEKRLTG